MNSQRTRWAIFASLFALMVISYTITLKWKIPTSPYIQKSYEFINSLPPSSVVIVSFDHEASSLPEIQPISQIILRHLFSRNQRIIGMSLFAEGTAIGYQTLNKLANEYGKKYGEDYVFLGFKPQHIAAILGMGESIKQVFPQDYLGNYSTEIPIMQGVENYQQIAAVISLADGDRTVQWIEYTGKKHGLKILGGFTAAMITTYDPYLSSGQLYSAIGGIVGAAEYEGILGLPGKGNRALLSQTAAHLFIVLLVIVGNIAYFRKRRGEK